VQDAYYAQCRVSNSTDDTPVTNDDGGSSNSTGYKCGTVVAGVESYVRQQYETWKARYVVSSASGSCVWQPGQGDNCVSEVRANNTHTNVSRLPPLLCVCVLAPLWITQGLGYGMILAASLGDQALFDDLWSFTVSILDSKGLPNWQLSSTGEIWGVGSASDADFDIALGLIMAADKFEKGNPGSPYLGAARGLIASILK
jgi:hypothetical protein